MAAKRPKRPSPAGPRSKEARSVGGSELDAALAGIAPPEDELDAGFFHRTLARWLGLPEGKGEAPTAVLWSYDFWKAEIVSLGAEHGRLRYAAQVYRGSSTSAERYEYWLELDAERRVRSSGWDTRAPDLSVESHTFTSTLPLSSAELATLFHDGQAED